jgi:hypothetical protein
LILDQNQAILAFLFTSHILATASFVAGLFCQLNTRDNLSNRLDRFGWLWLLLLGATGMFQMSASPNYQGLLNIGSIWAGALFIKHVLIVLLILFMAFQTFLWLPTINRELWKKSPDLNEIKETTKAENMHILGLRIELVLFFLILIATGITRAA